MRSRSPRLFRSAVIVAAALALLAAVMVGCGDSDNPETSATTAQAPSTTVQAPPTTTAPAEETSTTEGPSITRAEDLSDTIVLPDGWTMEDALTPADVEAVVGRTGLKFWMEPDSSASSGKPAGSFYDGTDIETKILFKVIAKGGQAEYERLTGFVENAEEVAADLWDKLVVGDATLVDYDLNRTLVLRGDVCMVIEWRPEHYSEFDRLDLGCRLADMLIAKLYKAG